MESIGDNQGPNNTVLKVGPHDSPGDRGLRGALIVEFG